MSASRLTWRLLASLTVSTVAPKTAHPSGHFDMVGISVAAATPTGFIIRSIDCLDLWEVKAASPHLWASFEAGALVSFGKFSQTHWGVDHWVNREQYDMHDVKPVNQWFVQWHIKFSMEIYFYFAVRQYLKSLNLLSWWPVMPSPMSLSDMLSTWLLLQQNVNVALRLLGVSVERCLNTYSIFSSIRLVNKKRIECLTACETECRFLTNKVIMVMKREVPVTFNWVTYFEEALLKIFDPHLKYIQWHVTDPQQGAGFMRKCFELVQTCRGI